MLIQSLKKSKHLLCLAKFLILSFILFGCTNPFHSWRAELKNTVVFDANFSKEEKATIMEGFNMWHESFGDGVGFTEAEDGIIKIHKGTNEDMAKFDEEAKPKKPVGLSSLHYHDKQIHFMFQRIPSLKFLKLVAAHEAGHHLGMGHVPQEQTAIMNPNVNMLLIDEQHLTIYDTDQFCNHWSCND